MILQKYDWLILSNDSVFGPFYPFEIIFKKMEKQRIDFWGFTKNTIDIKAHLQSYFVSINKSAFLSKEFRYFIKSIERQKNRKNVVFKYEHGLTEVLNKEGFKDASFFKEAIDTFTHDPAKDWDKMISERGIHSLNEHYLQEIHIIYGT